MRGGGWGSKFLAASGDIRLGDLATWTGALVTAGALVLALWQVFRERKERLRREVDDRAKAEEDRVERRLAHARLLSAWTGPAEPVRVPSDVPLQFERDLNWHTPIYMHNGSAEPVYNVVAGLVFIQGAAPRELEEMLDVRRRYIAQSAESTAAGNPPPSPEESVTLYQQPVTTLSILPPGTWRTWIQGGSWGGVMAGRLGVDLAFTDRAGENWVRRAKGLLTQLDKKPFEHFQQYGLYGPLDLVQPEPL